MYTLCHHFSLAHRRLLSRSVSACCVDGFVDSQGFLFQQRLSGLRSRRGHPEATVYHPLHVTFGFLHGEGVDVLSESLDAAALERLLHCLGERVEHLDRIQTSRPQAVLDWNFLERLGLLRRKGRFLFFLFHGPGPELVAVVVIRGIVLFQNLRLVHQAVEERARRVFHLLLPRVRKVTDGLEGVPNLGGASHGRRVALHLKVQTLEQHVPHAVFRQQVHPLLEEFPHVAVVCKAACRRNVQVGAVFLRVGFVIQVLVPVV
mmetsp:Transcript_22387/g.55329  ORF Transcript_22387/g.55329 Transcript_22387/m.55329 type:complete len:261 (-) Transcript_22387:633-1415(-)